MATRDKSKPVCVTGGSGFIGAHVVKALLRRGYIVRATVRDVNNPKKTAHLRNLDGAKERLSLYRADLLEEHSFDRAFQGCCAVFHTASPFFINHPSEATLTKPALDGTMNVLRSMKQCPEMERLILTSSTAAVLANFGQKPQEHVYSEADWSLVEKLRANHHWYPLGKTLAEKAAFEFVQEANGKNVGFDVVSLNPTLVLGPMLQPNLNESSKYIRDMIVGETQELLNAARTFVDVRDVAVAHVLAFENKNASGRYLLIAESAFAKEVATELQALCPNDRVTTNVSTARAPTPVYGPQQPAHVRFTTQKAQELGVSFTPLKHTIAETVQSLRHHQLID